MQLKPQQLCLENWAVKSAATQKLSPVDATPSCREVRIPLTQGKEVIIDEIDFERVSKFHWRVYKDRKRFYARHTVKRKGKYFHTLMHRLILNAKKGDKIDHRDLNGLNNKRSNIRFATQSQNAMNTIGVPTQSGFKGVHLYKKGGWMRFQARIKKNGKVFCLGYFVSAIDAAEAYNAAAHKLFGEYARPNVIPSFVQ